MRIILNLLILTVFLNSVDTKAQSSIQAIDSTKSISLLKRSIIPVTLISLGILANNSNFEKELQINLRNKVGNSYELRIDDFLQYAPIAEMYTADALGIKAKNHWFDQTKYLLISNLISSTITHSVKRITQKDRPNGSPYSFPSGHTTLAFTNAAVLFNEFYETAPVLAYSGYAFATTTGAFRMINNKHYLSDVLVGAGIGILVTELVYHFEPFKDFNPFKKKKNITFLPQISNDNYGFYFAYNL
ncbi:MAG: phosphatase PAP2 family protein [Bacteroidales bacterium]|jgi:membrane-associated phospholipid phosphatase|nr:phosphatase PAP2 family protein [Bacteroidales bacterium]